ncbi:unnamed protein product [Oppiella nova]|uniref:Uncharacterized protein n=1 Tax=Oppiella nova TaxID=334625 RepID=A0A7R9LZY8_9ACAR|nr:unnamed protein product [Oppiella nova]CAG2168608.1 unnamed protein product [Oppiella nova]
MESRQKAIAIGIAFISVFLYSVYNFHERANPPVLNKQRKVPVQSFCSPTMPCKAANSQCLNHRCYCHTNCVYNTKLQMCEYQVNIANWAFVWSVYMFAGIYACYKYRDDIHDMFFARYDPEAPEWEFTQSSQIPVLMFNNGINPLVTYVDTALQNTKNFLKGRRLCAIISYANLRPVEHQELQLLATQLRRLNYEVDLCLNSTGAQIKAFLTRLFGDSRRLDGIQALMVFVSFNGNRDHYYDASYDSLAGITHDIHQRMCRCYELRDKQRMIFVDNKYLTNGFYN